ncbi:hypothetical protein S1361_34525 [Streptomyces cyanogenus]|uniref:GntR C-terminal domain-containing protein n=1 Tax=Streptomyces cyanogenus TaxID=80860 RepID=A0ABX7U0E6_STRCY|nr:hypothetical protein S1361_34525 [Streptomyces cyanogenus]
MVLNSAVRSASPSPAVNSSVSAWTSVYGEDGLSSRTFRARVWRGYQEEGAFARTRREHAAIHRALTARDPESARAAAAAHVGEVEEWLTTQLGP